MYKLLTTMSIDFINLTAAIASTIAAFYAIKSYLGSKKVFRHERFENKFYELVRLHKSNVDEMSMEVNGKIYLGRECFVPMFDKLKECYELVEKACKTYLTSENYTPHERMHFAYKIFFYGLYSKSENYYSDNLNAREKKMLTPVKLTLHHDRRDKMFQAIGKTSETKIDGQIHRLGHYYRHLFQTVCFVKDQKGFAREEKYNYLKTLRAQLTDYEQLLLYYNAMAWFSNEWHEVFVDYKFIKNIPLPLTKDFYITPHEHFAKEIEAYALKGEVMFEYDE